MMNNLNESNTNNFDYEEEMMEIDLRKLIYIILDKWYILLGVIIIAVGAAFIFNIFSVPKYESTTKLLVNEESSIGSSMLFSEFQGSYSKMANRLQIIKSPLVIERAKNILKKKKNKNAVIYFEKYEGEMDKKIDTNIIGNTDIIEISLAAEKPELAQTLTSAVAAAYKQYRDYQAREQSRRVLNYLEQQLKKAEKDLITAEQKVRNYQQQEGIISLDDEAGKLNDQLSKLESQKLTNSINLKEKQFQLKQVNLNLENLRNTLSADSIIITSSLIQKLREQLSQLKAEKIDYLNRGLASDSPEVKSLKKRIKNMEKNIKQYTKKMTENQGVVNNNVKLYNNLLSQKSALKSEITGLNEKSFFIQKKINEFEEKLKQLSEKRYKLAELQRKVTITKGNYSMLSQELEKSRIALERKTSDITIINHATLPENPVQPQKMLNITIAACLGLFTGTGIIFLMELFDNTLREKEELENFTDLPVLGIIPDFEEIEHKR